MDNPEINQTSNILEDVTKDCEDKDFHTFEYRCENDINLDYANSVENVTITDGFKYSHPSRINCIKQLANTNMMVTNSRKKRI